MGQRHQIYVKMPENLGVGGLHHQWLYGMRAVEGLARVVAFYKKTMPDPDDKFASGPLHSNTAYGCARQIEAIRSIYSLDQETGDWSYLHNLHEGCERGETPSECLDPRNGDNNDGITIIDLSTPRVFKYCFMNICHLEGEIEPKKLTPLSAREYLLCYYPFFMEKKGRFCGL